MEASAMFTRRLRWWAVGLALVLLAGAAVAWMLMPPSTGNQIRLGMSYEEAEAIARPDQLMASTIQTRAGRVCRWDCPDGTLWVTFGVTSDDTYRVGAFEFTPKSVGLWDRFRNWLGW
jgi:hypothetical protein